MYTANYKRRTKNKWSKGKREYQRSQLKALIRQDQIALHAPEETARIKQLLNDLTKLGEFPKDSKSIIQFTVRFFNIISFFQDDGLIQYQPDSVADLVEVANKVITVCGRQPTKTSWNQSNRGEKVTLDNVMLGAVWGLPIKPARFWISCSKKITIILDYHSPVFAQLPQVNRSTMTPEEAIVQMKADQQPAKDVYRSEKVWVTDAVVLHSSYSLSKIIGTNCEILIEALQNILSAQE